MESPNALDALENTRAKSLRTDTDTPLHLETRDAKFHEDCESSLLDRARTRTREPSLDLDPDQDQDRISGGERSSASFYSDDYENVSRSRRSLSSQSSSPSPPRGGRPRRVASSPLQRTGLHKGASRRTGPQGPALYPRPAGMRAQSLSQDVPPKGAHSPAKGMDVVTKRVLSARVLRISELRNALAELRLHADTLQRENRLLRQLQLRQERALQRHDVAEGEVAQLLARHANETHALRERIRRGRERERQAESARREADANLQKCRARLQKLQQLVDDQHLGEREELAHKLSLMQGRAQESERRVKELEKNMELSNGSFQRQLGSERRRTHDALQDGQALREELDRLATKLKEKERELDARNIYANRMLRRVPKKESETPTKRRDSSRSSSKAVQTEETTRSLEFPTPPPAITDGNELPPDGQADNYLDLKQGLQRSEQKGTEEWRSLEKEREQEKGKGWDGEMDSASGSEKERNGERERLGEMCKEVKQITEEGRVDNQRIGQEFSLIEARGTRERNGWGREEEERTKWSQSQNEKEKRKFHEGEEETWMREVELQANREEERQRKELLLAKMREIDMQTQGHNSDLFSTETRSSPQFSVPRNQNVSIFTFTEAHEGGKKGGGLKTQRTSQDVHLAFGSYAPSFGKVNPRDGLSSRSPCHVSGPLPGDGDCGPEQAILAKERKSNLMQQLFGSTASSPPPDTSGKLELLSSPSTARPPVGIPNGRRRDTDTAKGQNGSNPSAGRNTFHVSESRLAVKAITSLDDDIEEVTL